MSERLIINERSFDLKPAPMSIVVNSSIVKLLHS